MGRGFEINVALLQLQEALAEDRPGGSNNIGQIGSAVMKILRFAEEAKDEELTPDVFAGMCPTLVRCVLINFADMGAQAITTLTEKETT